MEFHTEQGETGSVVIIRPKGRLTMVSTPELRSLVTDTIEGGQQHIVIDLSTTEFIDSSGLGALMAGRRAAREAGGDLRIACPTEQVEMVLRLTNVDRLLEMYRSVETAVGAA
jgi:anti-sigma B factor antagonist